MLSPSQRGEQDNAILLMKADILRPDPTPAEIFAQAVGELVAGVIYESDPEERRRLAALLEQVFAAANRLAAKREAAA